jgi:ABC-type bacteriocin/lantibiotic exporter with double-glycine peptidase domain
MRLPFFAPECLQLSSMDCGVAAVYTLLRGHGLRVRYEDLRQRCQTGVDGTSVDSLGDLCNELGVELEQHVLPLDLAVGAMAGRYPLIAIIVRGRGIPHFVTVWRRLGSYLQVMDPAGGRTWVHKEQFEKELFVHPLRLPREQWSEWMESNSLRDALWERARALLPVALCEGRIAELLSQPEPERVRDLDAALRLLERSRRASGANTRAWNARLFERTLTLFEREPALVGGLAAIEVEGDTICTRGTVLLARSNADGAPRVRARTAAADSGLDGSAAASLESPDSGARGAEPEAADVGLFGQLRRLLPAPARTFAYGLLVAVLLSSVASTLELLLYRAALDAPTLFTTFDTRLGAALTLALLVVLILGLEASAAYGAIRLGRSLELELRMRTLHALPRAGDHFVRSRPTTDLAYRAHNLVTGAQMPVSVVAAARALGDLCVTLAAIAWLGAAYVLPVLACAVLLAASFVLTRSRLRELDTRNQVHASRLLTLFLDALRGSRPLRLHGYQDAFRSEQQRELELSRGTLHSLVRTGALLEGSNGLLAAALLVSVLLVYVSTASDPRLFVLLAFWAFRIPPAIRALVGFAQGYPLQSVALARLLEVTRYVRAASEEAEPSPAASVAAQGVRITSSGVSVIANQFALLDDVSVNVKAGEHIAVVGRSGSGKSSLVGLLLGFHEPSAGELLIDDAALDEPRRRALLQATVWVDPSVQLWNTSVRDNVDYAVRALERRSFLHTAELSDLLPVIDHLDRGLDTQVGPEGSLISGGEGQRIRLARGLRRAQVRLVVLDEAFRGLDRPTRERLTRNVRAAFPEATLLSVSHDIRSALEFPRVWVLEGGRIVEDAEPAALAGTPSRFKRLLEAEEHALQELWAASSWRRLHVAGGKVTDERTTH